MIQSMFLMMFLLPGQLAPTTSPDTVKPTGFPRSWEGHWKGTARAERPQGPPREFGMELRISSMPGSSRLKWVLVYEGEGRTQTRNYELVTEDAAQGHYRIDEKNSIVIDAYLVASTLHSQFVVQNQIITASYNVRGNELDFRLVSADAGRPITSGGQDGVPAVQAYEITSVQTATLKRTPHGVDGSNSEQ